MNKLIVIVGPTAIGKSSLGVLLAKSCNGEIVSADSMQVYKHMNIGTAKVTYVEQEGIPHHMLDICEPSESFSVAEYQKQANRIIYNILERGKTPILVGGTGLYVNSIIFGYNFAPQSTDQLLRDYLHKAAEEHGNQPLLKELQKVNPSVAAKLHVNDRKRIIRAWEVNLMSGKNIDKWADQKNEFGFQPYVYGLKMARDLLNKRINHRVDLMMEQGLIEEVSKLHKANLLGPVAKQALGYKEVVDYLRGRSSYTEMINIIKLETRKYAKRQMVWFKRYPHITWFDMEIHRNLSEIVDKIHSQLAGI